MLALGPIRLPGTEPRATIRAMARRILGWTTAAAMAAILFFGRRHPQAAPDRPAPPPENAFGPTIANPGRPPGPAPEGMVWIPGGEFSMGATASSEGLCEVH